MRQTRLHIPVARLLSAAVLLLLLPVLALCEEAAQYKLLFHSGRVVVGEIVLRNDEVVIVKDQRGARFQYPTSDIAEITELSSEQPTVSEQTEDEKASRRATNIKRTSLGVHLAGGVASIDGVTGGALAVDLLLGANNVGGRRIFLGGQVGYRALLTGAKPLSIIPIDVVMELPLMQSVHAPMIGAHIGYGIGIGGIRGGVNAGLALAYRYHFSRTGSLYIGIEGEVQQLASAPHAVIVEPGQTFYSDGGKTAVMGMISFGLLF